MKKHALLIITLLLFAAHTAYPTGGQTSFLPDGMPRRNFEAKVTLHDGTILKVANMTINNKFENIAVYHRPQNIEAQETIIRGTAKKQYTFHLAPEIDKTDIDLAEITRLYLPEPNATWEYIDDESGRSKGEFMEIAIDQGGTLSKYLIDSDTKIVAHLETKTGPIRRTWKPKAIREIIIIREIAPIVKPSKKMAQSKSNGWLPWRRRT